MLEIDSVINVFEILSNLGLIFRLSSGYVQGMFRVCSGYDQGNSWINVGDFVSAVIDLCF